MKRPALANVLTVIVILLGVVGVFGGYVAFGQYAVSQQNRADYLRVTVAEKNTIIAQKDDILASLLDKYTALTADCEQASDCITTAPAPEVIQQYIEGTPGVPGRPPTTTEINDAVRGYCGTRGDCRGVQGEPGPPGADSTVPGPQGDPGPAGVDGQPPQSWTYSDPLGFTYTCTRTTPFDPTAPTYRCTPN